MQFIQKLIWYELYGEKSLKPTQGRAGAVSVTKTLFHLHSVVTVHGQKERESGNAQTVWPRWSAATVARMAVNQLNLEPVR